MTTVERAEHELEQLNFWFKLNKNSQGNDEWNEKEQRGIDISEWLGGC
tara:strand:+ start:213 stop:356 length:144 start_codon:yes stop_codon:yes gene_type:complete